MKQFIFFVYLLAVAWTTSAQSKTTQALQTKFDGSLGLYFYKNTLRMLNQQESKEFDDLIRNVEKMKFLVVDKSKNRFSAVEYKKLTSDYRKELYDPIVTGRFEGKNLDIYLRDSKGSSPGTVVLVNDSSNLYVLDIVGTIDVTKAGALFSALDNNTDIGKKIRNFANPKADTVSRKKNRQKID